MPTVYSVLAQVPVDADISSLKLPIVGAAPLSPAVASAFEARTGVALCEGYGLTEGTCASARGWPTAQRSGTVGQRLPYQEAATVHVDEITGEWTFLPEGEVGTLVLRGPNIFAGYLAEGESGLALRPGDKLRNGWLDTGDLACIEADGFIRLAGRAKDLIIRGGHNIDPATIEDALLAHPEVTAAAAVGRPDAHAGEVPVAFVTLAQESELTPDHLLAWAASHVPERAAAPKQRGDLRHPADRGGQAIQAGAAAPRRPAGGAGGTRRDFRLRPRQRCTGRRLGRDPHPAVPCQR